MSLGNAFPVRSNVPDLIEVRGVWTGGGSAANCTHTSTDWSVGIASINYDGATGKYTITFVDVGAQLLEAKVDIHRVAGEAPLVANVPLGSFSTTTKQLDFEVWDVDGTSALTDIPATAKVCVKAVFAKNIPGS